MPPSHPANQNRVQEDTHGKEGNGNALRPIKKQKAQVQDGVVDVKGHVEDNGELVGSRSVASGDEKDLRQGHVQKAVGGRDIVSRDGNGL